MIWICGVYRQFKSFFLLYRDSYRKPVFKYLKLNVGFGSRTHFSVVKLRNQLPCNNISVAEVPDYIFEGEI